MSFAAFSATGLPRLAIPKMKTGEVRSGLNQMTAIGRDFAGGIHGIFKSAASRIKLDFSDLGGSLKSFGKGLLDDFKSLGLGLLRQSASQLLGGLAGGGGVGAPGGLFSNLLGGAGGLLGGLFGFAGGGRVSPGSPVLVGERGPELILPDRAMTVINGGDSEHISRSSALTLAPQQSISVTADVRDTVKAQVLEMLPAIEGRVMDRMARARVGIR